MSTSPSGGYLSAGVDIHREDTALGRLAARIRATWPQHGGVGSVQLPLGYFANVIDIGGQGLAITTDGVGTKVLIAQMADRYETIGIDCVAMNVNDLLCVGARPLSMVDYIAVESLDPDMLDEIARGLCAGAGAAGISIPGGEIAQMRDVISGATAGRGFDIAGTAIGTVSLDRIIVGQDVQEGDILIGLASNGIHSNGLSLARRVLFEQKGYTIDTVLPDLGCTLGEELLRPTHIYVREILDMLDGGIAVKALIHITGEGFLNLARVASDTGWAIERLPAPPEIFRLIQRCGAIGADEMYRVFNMGIGFCVVVPPDEADRALAIIGGYGKSAYRIGHATRDSERRVVVQPEGLVSHGKKFVPA